MSSESTAGAASPLAGFTIAITAARRSDELAALLVRRGARVRSAAAIAMVPLADDTALRMVTDALIDEGLLDGRINPFGSSSAAGSPPR